jgi:hypothetical protein
MARITFAKLYSVIKGVIAELKGIDRADVHADDKLADDLGFTAAGVRDLLRRLATAIGQEVGDTTLTLDPSGLNDVVTVRDLANFIWKQLPDRYKDQ